MAQIRHCGLYRRTRIFWLNSNDEAYKYQQLLEANCPLCGNHVLEWVGVFADGRKSAANRIAIKHQDTWIARTKKGSGDLAEGVDSSTWKTVKDAVYRVTASNHEFPWNLLQVRVQ